MSITTTEFLQKTFQKILEPEGKSISEKEIRGCLSLSEDLMQWKIRLKDILKIPEDHIKALYAFAYDFYQKKNLKSASNLFTLLTVYDPWCEKYWEGLGATKKLNNDYNEALTAYFVLTQVKPLKISYYLEIAEIFIKLKQFDAALQCCEAVDFMANDPTYKRPENEDAEICLKRSKTLQKVLKKK